MCVLIFKAICCVNTVGPDGLFATFCCQSAAQCASGGIMLIIAINSIFAVFLCGWDFGLRFSVLKNTTSLKSLGNPGGIQHGNRGKAIFIRWWIFGNCSGNIGMLSMDCMKSKGQSVFHHDFRILTRWHMAHHIRLYRKYALHEPGSFDVVFGTDKWAGI